MPKKHYRSPKGQKEPLREKWRSDGYYMFAQMLQPLSNATYLRETRDRTLPDKSSAHHGVNFTCLTHDYAYIVYVYILQVASFSDAASESLETRLMQLRCQWTWMALRVFLGHTCDSSIHRTKPCSSGVQLGSG